MTITISNWYCPNCRRYLASQDVLCGKHAECKSRVRWERVQCNNIGIRQPTAQPRATPGKCSRYGGGGELELLSG